ncbi:hypothetical protein OSTOST_02120, partial [Ostertagia ostertagi]
MRALLILNALFTTVLTLKILVYSAPLGYSHMQFMGAIADILHEAGHDVLLFDLPESIRRQFDRREMGLWKLASSSVLEQLKLVLLFSNLQSESCEYILGDNHTMDFLRNEHFDVGISEVFALCGFGVFELANTSNVVAASAVGVIDIMKEFIEVPIMPSFMP